MTASRRRTTRQTPRLVWAALGLLPLLAACRAEPTQVRASLEVADLLGGEAAAGFARALASRPFVFPDDHGPHPDFRSEWWYWTGNLATADGRAFGFQLTFFRGALAPPDADARRSSAWATRQGWMAHFAVADVDAKVGTGAFHSAERFARGAVGLAGARATPFRVWTGPWSATAVTPPVGADGLAPGLGAVRLRAALDAVAIDLTLSPRKALVFQGDHGLAAKGPEAGNASYYYSATRLAATGTVHLADGDHAVRGTAWLDREWSTSALGPDETGWDWFALQLADGRELMLYQLRRRDGTRSPFSAGTLVAADGTTVRLADADFTITPTATWTSPRGGTYPSRWRLAVPSAGLDLDVRPRLTDQELAASVRYWEGAVSVSGSVDGVGYVELTGYAGH
jgi:predicted secreted hydrolase